MKNIDKQFEELKGIMMSLDAKIESVDSNVDRLAEITHNEFTEVKYRLDNVEGEIVQVKGEIMQMKGEINYMKSDIQSLGSELKETRQEMADGFRESRLDSISIKENYVQKSELRSLQLL